MAAEKSLPLRRLQALLVLGDEAGDDQHVRRLRRHRCRSAPSRDVPDDARAEFGLVHGQRAARIQPVHGRAVELLIQEGRQQPGGPQLAEPGRHVPAALVGAAHQRDGPQQVAEVTRILLPGFQHRRPVLRREQRLRSLCVALAQRPEHLIVIGGAPLGPLHQSQQRIGHAPHGRDHHAQRACGLPFQDFGDPAEAPGIRQAATAELVKLPARTFQEIQSVLR